MSSDSIALGQFVHLVEEMRQAQEEVDQIEAGRDGHRQAFALTRAKQKRKVKEQRVDSTIVQFHKDLEDWARFTGGQKHSEQLALYNATHEEQETQSGGA